MTYNQGVMLAGLVMVNCGNGTNEVRMGWVFVFLSALYGAVDLFLEIRRAKKGRA